MEIHRNCFYLREHDERETHCLKLFLTKPLMQIHPGVHEEIQKGFPFGFSHVA